MKRKRGRRYITKGLSLPPEMAKAVVVRMKELQISNFSRYCQDLIRRDVKEAS